MAAHVVVKYVAQFKGTRHQNDRQESRRMVRLPAQGNTLAPVGWERILKYFSDGEIPAKRVAGIALALKLFALRG